MDVVELGGVRLHLLGAFPGLPHEGERVVRTLTRLAPAVILGDVDTDDALRIRAALTQNKPFEPSFVDAFFRDEAHRRFAPKVDPGEHPLVAAARYARDRHAQFVPLRAIASRPGFLARRRAQRALRAAEAKDPAALAHAFEVALAQAGVWRAQDEVEAAHGRMLRALSDGRAPIIAVLQAHRQAAFEDAVLATGRIPA